MAIRKSKFDWSVFDRHDLLAYLWSLYPTIANQEMTIPKFHRILGTFIQKQIPIKLKKLSDTKVEYDTVWIGGAYYSDLDKLNKKSIELVIVYSKLDKIKLSKKRYLRVCYNVANTIMHEIIHMRQYRRRKFKTLPEYASNAEKTEQHKEQTYLGHSDEIDAYGFNIACELMDKFKNDTTKVIDYLNEDQNGLRRKQNSWRMYLKAFNHNHEHPIIKRTKKKIVRYLPYAIYGKPYKNKDWISN